MNLDGTFSLVHIASISDGNVGPLKLCRCVVKNLHYHTHFFLSGHCGKHQNITTLGDNKEKWGTIPTNLEHKTQNRKTQTHSRMLLKSFANWPYSFLIYLIPFPTSFWGTHSCWIHNSFCFNYIIIMVMC